MNAETTRDEIRIRQFDARFPRIEHRESWLTMYLTLRDDGDTHSEAVETILSERAVAARLAK